MVRGSVLALFAAAVLAGSGPAGSAGGCVGWAGPNGSDSGPATASQPFRTLGHLYAWLQPGQTGCVVEGTRFDEHISVTKPNVHVRVFGRPATLNGRLRFRRDARGSSIDNVVVRGDGPGRGSIVTAAAAGVTLAHLDVSGPNFVNGRATCVRVAANAVVVRDSKVHDCTRITKKNAYAPGIVVASGVGARVRDNIVFHVPGDGIVVGSRARGVVVTHNLLYANTSGVGVHGGASGTVVDNVISYSGRFNVHGDGGGTGVSLTRNCIWGASRRDVSGSGFRAFGNLVVPPRFAARDKSFALLPGPCASKAPGVSASSAPAPSHSAPKPKPAARAGVHVVRTLPRFTVQYTLRALPGRVEFISLSFTGLRNGATVDVSCARGCSAHERLTAQPGGTAFSNGLGGRWIPKGGVVDVQETLRGWRGVYARIRIAGLPRGVVIAHGTL